MSAGRLFKATVSPSLNAPTAQTSTAAVEGELVPCCCCIFRASHAIQLQFQQPQLWAVCQQQDRGACLGVRVVEQVAPGTARLARQALGPRADGHRPQLGPPAGPLL